MMIVHVGSFGCMAMVKSGIDDDIDMRALKAFLAVLDHGGMTAAAGALGLTQSAVSQAVARLEKSLDVDLIDRDRRPPVATAAGEELAERARRVLADFSELADGLRHAGNQARPRVRLGLIDSVAGTIGAPLIRAIRDDVREVSVWSGISPTLGRDLAAGRLDLIVSSNPSMAAGHKPKRLLREPFIAVLPKALRHRPEIVDPIRMAERLPLVRYSVRSVIGEDIERELATRGRVPPRVFEFDGTDGVFAMVAEGLGWAVTTPLCLVHGQMYADDLVAVPLSGPVVSREIYLLAANVVGAGLAANVRRAAIVLLTARGAGDVTRLAPDAVRHIRVG